MKNVLDPKKKSSYDQFGHSAFEGGGGGAGTYMSGYVPCGGKGGVRIIWGGGRAFPSTNTTDVTQSV